MFDNLYFFWFDFKIFEVNIKVKFKIKIYYWDVNKIKYIYFF